MSTYYDELYTFLKANYRYERFEGRNCKDFPDYAGDVTRGRLRDLEQRGYDLISRHESASGRAIYFRPDLSIIPTEDVPTLFRA